MANTYELISSVTLTSTTGFSSVSFTSIPQTYKDLVVWVSSRSDRGSADGLERVYLYLNGSSSGITMINSIVNSTTYYSDSYTTGNGVGGTCGLGSGTNAPANQFGFTKLYISDYTTTNAKIGINVSTLPIGGGSTLNYNYSQSYSHTTSTGITSITTSGLGTNWLSGSTWYLYGIK